MGGPILDALPDPALRYVNQQIQGLTSRVDVRYLANVIGDGIADDTDNLHNAFAKAAANGVEAVLGPGSYLLKGTVPLVDKLAVWQSPAATIVGANTGSLANQALFQSGSAVTFTWRGNSGLFTGQAPLFFSCVGFHSLIEGIIFKNLSGANFDCLIALQTGSSYSVIRHCYGDGSGVSGTGHFDTGYAISGNYCGIESSTLVNGVTCNGLKFFDCRQGWARDFTSIGNRYGATFSSDGLYPTNGCVECSLRGGFYNSNSIDGVVLSAGSSQCVIDGAISTSNMGYGLNLDGTGGGNMVGNIANNLILLSNTAGALNDAGTNTQKGLIVTS